MNKPYMRRGTAHFPSFMDAVRYYSVNPYTLEHVRCMIADGTISIGQPTNLQPGERAVIVNEKPGRRYHIVEEI